MSYFEKVKELVNSSQDDFAKFYDNGNGAAGTRIRKVMMELKNIAQEIRLDVQSKKNS